jgi:hypothetical protein
MGGFRWPPFAQGLSVVKVLCPRDSGLGAETLRKPQLQRGGFDTVVGSRFCKNGTQGRHPIHMPSRIMGAGK